MKDIYAQGYINDELIELGITKLYQESECFCIHVAKILVELSSLTKKRNGVFSLTKNGETKINDNHALFLELWKAFTTTLSWRYFDQQESIRLAKFVYAFSIIMISKYGDISRETNFYANKYINAFPNLREEVEIYYHSLEETIQRCFQRRFFDRFLALFGVIDYDNCFEDLGPSSLVKNDLFDKLFKVTPPRSELKLNVV